MTHSTIIGVIGAGQLARMLALAGLSMGLKFRFLDPAKDACAFPLGEAVHAAFDDEQALARLADGTDVVTYEFENISREGVAFLKRKTSVQPNPEALFVKQDRLDEKQLFVQLGIPTTDFRMVATEDDLEQAVDELGWPLVIKTRSFGYDGKGQWIIKDASALDEYKPKILKQPCLAERFVRFDREVSIVAVRDASGDMRFYPLSENVHREGILRTARSRPGDSFTDRARDYAGRLLEHFNYIGVLAVEFFQVGDELWANEFAPRVHNTGHWTIEGAETSQFENHLRAILGFPLGSVDSVGCVFLINLIGCLPDPCRILTVPGVHMHIYGKKVRAKRKVGHITIRGNDETDLRKKIDLFKEALKDEILVNEDLMAV